MPKLTEQEIKRICKAKCEQHGVNIDFFLKKILQLYPNSEKEVISYLDELMFVSFHTNYDEMYDGLVPSNECI